MTQQTTPPLALPQTHILSYITTVSNPTRVRLIAARATVIAGIACVGLILLLAGLIAYDAYTLAKTLYADYLTYAPFGPPAPAPSLFQFFKDAIPYALRENLLLLTLFPFLLTGAPVAFAAPAIKRGRRPASIIGMIFFAAAMLVVFLATLYAGVRVFAASGVVIPGPHRPLMLLWLIVVPAGGALCVLLKDLFAFLQWIARNPTVEKPPVPFLPGPSNPQPAGAAP